MTEFRSIKGTHDLLPNIIKIWQKCIYPMIQFYVLKEKRNKEIPEFSKIA